MTTIKREYPSKKTLGSGALAPYRALGRSIRRDLVNANFGMMEFSEKSGWDWQTIRRILMGERRTDFVELLIIALLISEDQSEAERLILAWTKETLKIIEQEIPQEINPGLIDKLVEINEENPLE
ncbi:MAG: hypothetical protein ACKPEN_17490 [Planktothrix sp.]|jgi:hypothetical protein|uniref:hypothetical protein n=1 Tax=Planktothrix sp. TaxID=3088171 RepID=UPI0038D3FC99